MSNPFKRLASWFANLRASSGPAAAAPACGLGVDGLPSGLDLLPVGTPVALAWQTGAAGLQWAHALVQDLLAGGPVMLLAENERHADSLLQHPALLAALQQGRLRVWLMDAQLAQAHRPDGMEPVLKALQRAGLTPVHALLVLASAQCHLGSSVASAQRWARHVSRWSQERTRPVLFAFAGWQDADEVLKPLLSVAESFQHVALLGNEARQPVLFLERWNGSEGPLYAVRLGLRHDPAHQGPQSRLAYDGSQMRGDRQQLVEAPDQHDVLATQAALAGQGGVPSSWTVLQPGTDVVGASEDAVAATLLLHAGSANQLEELLQQVYQLRQQHGRALKIVVRETQDKLRATVEQALLHLGANRVVYREVGFARLQHMLEELHDETFTRDLQPDYASARAAFSPEPLRGYLPAHAFCDAVQAMLTRTETSGLHHSFLRLSMRAQVAHLDAVRTCLAMRDGDLVTTDQSALYVFMFACAEADMAAALGRLFTVPPDTLFATQTLFSTTEDMYAALQTLREAARLGLPDYSAYRNTRQVPQPVAATSQTPAASPNPGSSLAAVPAEADNAAPMPPVAPTVHARALARREADTPRTTP